MATACWCEIRLVTNEGSSVTGCSSASSRSVAVSRVSAAASCPSRSLAMAVTNGYGMLVRDQAGYERGIISNWMFFSVIEIGRGLARVRSGLVSVAISSDGRYQWLRHAGARSGWLRTRDHQ